MREKFLQSLTTTELSQLQYDWQFWARDKQLLPKEDFFIWMILAGRGFGKTRTGAETVRQWVKTNRYVNLIGATADDARDIMIEGESGIMAICPNGERPEYKKSERQLNWPNGALSLVFTADEPERLRGKQHEKVWADELASWRYPEAWDQAMLGLRLGARPQGIVTTTPRATKLIKELVTDKRNVVTRGSTYENRVNLAKGFFDYVITKYEGTRLGRQELYAEILEDIEGALWKRDLIDRNRVLSIPIPDEIDFPENEMPWSLQNKPKQQTPTIDRMIVGVDPSATSTGDEAGIVTAALAYGDYWVLADDSIQASPKGWASAAITAYHKLDADLIVAESNNGGEMVLQVIKNIDPNVRVMLVHASRGKATRAEPIVALYEQNRVHHVGMFGAMEDEMCSWVPGSPSPNRLDALVWALTELSNGIDNTIEISTNPFYR